MSEYESPKVGGPAVERVWTCIASNEEDENGDAIVSTIGKSVGERTRELVACFAWKGEAETWLELKRAGGWSVHGPTPIAMLYYGHTDSPANAWSVRAERVEAQTQAQESESWTGPSGTVYPYDPREAYDLDDPKRRGPGGYW